VQLTRVLPVFVVERKSVEIISAVVLVVFCRRLTCHVALATSTRDVIAQTGRLE